MLYKVATVWGNQLSNVLFQRILAAYGIPYSTTNRGDFKLTAAEANVYPKKFNMTVQTISSTNVSKYVVAQVNDTDFTIPHFMLPHPTVNQTLNVQAFKAYWNVNNPTNQIVNPETNILDADTQNKLLTATPLTGFGATTCDAKCTENQLLDLVIILDGSGSVNSTNFQKELQFVVDVVAQLPVSQDLVRVGVVVFSTSVTATYDLNYFLGNAELAATVPTIPYPAQYTWTGLALEEAKEMLTNISRGARGVEIPKVIIM